MNQFAQIREEVAKMWPVFDEISRLIEEMGFDAPKRGDPPDMYAPKILAFVRAMKEREVE